MPLNDRAILVHADDVMQYLRQHDDVVFRGPEGVYLVNGAFPGNP